MKFQRICLSLTSLLVTALTPAFIFAADRDASTQILKWKDGKKAVFMLAFDDSAPSQLKNVVPELERRKMVGNFYLVTGNSLYSALKRRWEDAAKSPYVAVANHTFTHKGVDNAVELEPELALCNEVLYKLKPEGKQPRLFGFGRPGGVPWKVTAEEQKTALAKHQLCDRPPFFGPPIHYKSAAETVAAVDAAIAKGEMGHLDFHGVGEDWLVTPVEWFTALLDKLESVREEVWITDVVSWHQYVTERSSAEIKSLKSDQDAISLELTCRADPVLYDMPLTLSTQVPADWKKSTVTQGSSSLTATVRDGKAQYDALPGGGVITLKKAE
ncbi:MAG: Polysaccharide deacetylase [Prosthecobacter sp.]|nr:Polysaccharide deacetylase [Prosthecobacter sp.]